MICVHSFLKGLIGGVFFGFCCSTFAQLDMELAKKKCADLGFKAGTERFGACVLQLSKPDDAKPVINTRPSETIAQPIKTPNETPVAVVAMPVSPVPAFIPSDIVAETRGYEAAQGQRRVGNYQGAIVAFQNFLAQYPKSNLAPRAQYWIGDSYFNLNDFKLAIAAQQTLVKTYPDSAPVPDAMLAIASSQMALSEPISGRKTLEELMAKFPNSDAASKAQRRVNMLIDSAR